MKNFYCLNRDSFQQTPRLNDRLARECPDSRLSLEWFSFDIIPDIPGKTHVGIEVMSLQEFCSGKSGVEMNALKAIRQAVMPMVLEYRTALLDLDANFKSLADSKGTSSLRYLCSWLRCRISDAAIHASTFPPPKMANAVAKFKPTSFATFEAELTTSGYALKLFPEVERTQARCELAVKAESGALALVPGSQRTRTLCESACSNLAGIRALQHVPIPLRDAQMCNLAVRTDGRNLEFVPRELLTIDICALACTRSGLSLELVPKQFRVPEVMFCVAIHGLCEQSSGQIYDELAKTDKPRADAMYDKYAALHMELHYPDTPDSELEDMGMRLSPAA